MSKTLKHAIIGVVVLLSVTFLVAVNIYGLPEPVWLREKAAITYAETFCSWQDYYNIEQDPTLENAYIVYLDKDEPMYRIIVRWVGSTWAISHRNCLKPRQMRDIAASCLRREYGDGVLVEGALIPYEALLNGKHLCDVTEVTDWGSTIHVVVKFPDGTLSDYCF